MANFVELFLRLLLLSSSSVFSFLCFNHRPCVANSLSLICPGRSPVPIPFRVVRSSLFSTHCCSHRVHVPPNTMSGTSSAHRFLTSEGLMPSTIFDRGFSSSSPVLICFRRHGHGRVGGDGRGPGAALRDDQEELPDGGVVRPPGREVPRGVSPFYSGATG